MFKPNYLKKSLILPALISLSANSAEIMKETGFNANTDIILFSEDNILRNELAINDESLTLAPTITYNINTGKQAFSFKYLGNYRAFNQQDYLNYNNHQFSSDAQFIFTDRLSVSANAFFEKDIESVNTTYSDKILADFTQLETRGVSGSIMYGTYASTGQLVFSVGNTNVDYKNNEQSFRNVDINSINATFYYRVAPKTRLLLSATSTNHDYDFDSIGKEQSSKTFTARVGAEWELTAQTTGRVEVGYFEKNMNSNLLNDLDGLSYLINLDWKPIPFTNIYVQGSRSTKESSVIESNAYINTKFRLGLQYDFTERTSLKAGLMSEKAELETRDDKILVTSLGIEHSLRDWLSLEIFYDHSERDSDVSLYAYDADIYGIRLTTSF